MPRLFLAWVAALCTTSWVGITLAEAAAFTAWLPLACGVAAFVAVLLLLRDARLTLPGDDGSGAARRAARAAWAVPLLAFALTATLWPIVDTTLVSQDASIHRASGRWLARTGTLGIHDSTFATLNEDDRVDLFGGASVSPQRLSLTRLPGGIVLPDTFADVAYPSFSHLLAVWVAIADGAGGEAAIALLGPLFAATAWWAIGLIALLDAGLLAALAAPVMLASLLPEHWFARYLMPEILAQALVWSGVAAARLAEAGEGTARARLVSGVLCGVALGVSGFARLEQFWVFVPALLVTRALLSHDRRVLPRGALLPFVLLAAHAVLHVFLVPTDYANRIYKTAIQAYAVFVVFVSTLSNHDGYVTGFLLNRVMPVAFVGGLAAWLWIGRRVDRRRPGFLVRVSAAAVALPWLVLLYRSGFPEHFAALRSLLLYVPWLLWGAVALGVLRRPLWPGLEIAILLQALDQVIQARVTDLQPWASRRVVTVVLPILVLAAVRALAPSREAEDDPLGKRVRPPAERWVAATLVALAIVLATARVAPVLARPIQSGGAELVAKVGKALPPSAYVIVAEPLGWLHLAAALWLGEGPTTLVAREQPWFPPALERFLALPLDRPFFVLSGAVAAPGQEPNPDGLVPPLPAGVRLERVATFAWPTTLLEATPDHRPDAIVPRNLDLGLYRVVLPQAADARQGGPG